MKKTMDDTFVLRMASKNKGVSVSAEKLSCAA
jgi:hypothetical protein